jgi:predicted RNA-binding protein YlxR (DUF448 family)
MSLPRPLKHTPIRTCAVCRASVPQELLDRLTLEGGELKKDEGPKSAGRGVYVHPEHDLSDVKTRERVVRNVKRGGQK